MDGGPSQVDTFDPKPRLTPEHGQPFKMKMEPTQFNNNGNTLGCPWKFKQYGQSGMPVSDLFPHVGDVRRRPRRRPVDDAATSPSTRPANYFLHTGSGHAGPAEHGGVGRATAWAASARICPGFVVLNGGLIPPGGLDNFNSGFLPATYQGSVFKPAQRAGREHQARRGERRRCSRASSR